MQTFHRVRCWREQSLIGSLRAVTIPDHDVNGLGDDEACDNITQELGIQTGNFSPEEAQRIKNF